MIHFIPAPVRGGASTLCCEISFPTMPLQMNERPALRCYAFVGLRVLVSHGKLYRLYLYPIESYRCWGSKGILDFGNCIGLHH